MSARIIVAKFQEELEVKFQFRTIWKDTNVIITLSREDFDFDLIWREFAFDKYDNPRAVFTKFV